MDKDTDLSTMELIDERTNLIINFYRRPGSDRWYAEINHTSDQGDSFRTRRSTGTADAMGAVQRAREIAAEAWREIKGGIAGEVRAAVASGRKTTWAEAIELYEKTELPRIDRRHSQYGSTVRSALTYRRAGLPLEEPILNAGPALVRRLVDIMETGRILEDDGSERLVITIGPDGREKVRGPARPERFEADSACFPGWWNVCGRQRSPMVSTS
jgi:hypothetical protein